jgi:hypothetical protein
VKVELYRVDRSQGLLSTIFLEGKNSNGAMIKAGVAAVD